MSAVRLETERLVLRKFGKGDMEALYLLLRDREVNAFLPWFAVNSMRETEEFYEKRFEGKMH